MGVQRFRSLEEAERALWAEPGSPQALRAMRAVAQLARLAPRVPSARGVRKFRSIEEANLDREEWEARVVEAAQGRVRK